MSFCSLFSIFNTVIKGFHNFFYSFHKSKTPQVSSVCDTIWRKVANANVRQKSFFAFSQFNSSKIFVWMLNVFCEIKLFSKAVIIKKTTLKKFVTLVH